MGGEGGGMPWTPMTPGREGEELSLEMRGEPGGPWRGGGFGCVGSGGVSVGEGHQLDFTKVSLAPGEDRLCGDTWQARNSDGF